MIEIIH